MNGTSGMAAAAQHYHINESLLIHYHTGEEILIALICLAVALRARKACLDAAKALDKEQQARIFLLGCGFLILGVSSLIHATIHAANFSPNLLYQTLLGYCLGLLTMILAIAAEKPQHLRGFPYLYIPLLILLLPDIYTKFPYFNEFRPLVWISVAYLSGVVCMIYAASYYRTAGKRFLYSAAGLAMICISAAFLFFPAPIGSGTWLQGHLLRPVGFVILFFSITREDLFRLHGSILYRALTAFSLLAALPLLIFGSVVFYENIAPINILDRRMLIFILLLVTLASALLFGLGMIIRLIRPILQLKQSVDRLSGKGQDKRIEVMSTDEIGELSRAFNDMTHRLDRAIEEQERMCRMAATGELAATLAHEIRNPLNAIRGAATYVNDNYDGTLIQEFNTIILDEVQRINLLTTALLSYAKPITPEFAVCDINQLVNETITLLSHEAKELDIMLEQQPAPALRQVSCDYNQIKQIVINLVINGFDAIRHQGRITIKTRELDNDVEIIVKDNGTGITKDHLKQIFNPFFSTKTRGTGIGLAISQKIAREHGGNLKVVSEPGRGSTFTLSLPGGK